MNDARSKASFRTRSGRAFDSGARPPAVAAAAAAHVTATTAAAPIRVLCVEEHALVRDGIAALLKDASDVEVVGHATTPDGLVHAFGALKPDVMLIDPWFDGSNHVHVIAALAARQPDVRIIVLAVHQNEQETLQAIAAGAMAYVAKDADVGELLRAIRHVHAGRRLLPAAIEAKLAALPTLRKLTRREVEVLELVARGLRNREIGTSLGISSETVQVHVRNILSKLDVPDRTAATCVAIRRGLIRL